MAALRMAFAIALLASASAAGADPLGRWAAPIAEASARFAIPQAWIRDVIRIESGGRQTVDGRPVVSRAGAMGLMQLMPETWRAMRALLGLGSDPHDPRDNILAGTFYLRLLYDRFGYPGLFAAYNAGPSRYSAFLAGNRALPLETQAYVRRAGRMAGQGEQARSALFLSAAMVQPAPVPSGVFAVAPAAGMPRQALGGGSNLFVPLSAERNAR